MPDLTMVMAVYGQPKMLDHQLETIRRYPPEVSNRLAMIVVDDHGDPAVDEDWIREVASVLDRASLFRVDVDIPWNEMGAKNLAMQHANGPCILMDPDMVFSPAMMGRMLHEAKKLRAHHVIRWGLKHEGGKKIDTSSPNTWLIHKADFDLMGGYDEDYAGHYGWADVHFLHLVKASFKMIVRADLYADFFSVKQIEDAAVTKLSKSVVVNRELHLKKFRAIQKGRGLRDLMRDNRKATKIRFPWTKLF